MPAFCDIALPIPLYRLFTYAVNGVVPAIGARVIVPFSGQMLMGVAMRLHDDPLPEGVEAKPIQTVMDQGSLLSEDQMELARWIAQYYCAPLGEVIRSMLPLAAEVKRQFIYRITEAGRRHLHDWLAVPARPHGNRIELLLKLFFGDKAAPAVMRAQVDAAKARAIADLHRYQAMRDRIEADCASHPGMPYWRMTLRFGIAEAHATVQWADETLQELESLDSKA